MESFYAHPLLVGVVSFGLLALASYCVGEGGEILGKKYDASIIGGLLIAWLNTAPETIFFISALRSGNPRFAVGAVSGSTIVVSTVAIGICLYLGSRARKGSYVRIQPAVKTQALFLACSTIVPVITCVFGFSNMLTALGIGSYMAFLVYTLYRSRKSVTGEKAQDLESGVTKEKQQRELVLDLGSDDDSDDEEDEHEEPVWKGVAYLTIGGLLIFTFSDPFIDSVSSFASSMALNPTLLAFFLAPVASEMPEILESISLSMKGNANNVNIAFSNLVGGTITKTTLLMGIFSMYGVSRNIHWESPSYTVSIFMMILCAITCGIIGYMMSRQTKIQSYILFSLFILTCIIQYHFNSTLEPEKVTTPVM